MAHVRGKNARHSLFLIFNWVSAALDRPGYLDAHVADVTAEDVDKAVDAYAATLPADTARHTIAVLHGASIAVYLQGRVPKLGAYLYRVGGTQSDPWSTTPEHLWTHTPVERLWSTDAEVNPAQAREQWQQDMAEVRDYLDSLDHTTT